MHKYMVEYITFISLFIHYLSLLTRNVFEAKHQTEDRKRLSQTVCDIDKTSLTDLF